ncbi:MAG: hypothetical protein HHJ11_16760 [Phycicoccus sp.]|nr:hypothetical protein [Phycicoccus sp.]
MSRTRYHEGVCWECDNKVAAYEGPVAGHEYEYLVREVAEALVSVGRGMTYTDAAKRARKAANRARKNLDPGGGPDADLDPDDELDENLRAAGDTVPKADPTSESDTKPKEKTVTTGQTVADWLGEFVPVVAAQHQEKAWPQTIVLDSTEFMDTNSRTSGRRQLFAVLAAWGYAAGEKEGHLWKVAAAPADDAMAWKEFLASIPGRPELVVCDRDYAIIGGVQRHWGRGKAQVPIHLCEHHMFDNGLAKLKDDGIEFEDPLRVLFASAFQSLAGWDAFDAATQGDPRAVNTRKWVRHWRKRMRVQTARRASIPPHYGNGAVEAPIRQVRQVIERRKFTFRNLARMNLLLELVRLRLLRADSVRAYAEDIRTHLVLEGDRRKPSYRAVYDTWGPRIEDKPRTRVYSLLGWARVEGDRPDAHTG